MMGPEEVAEGLTVDPFIATAEFVRDEWLVVWAHEGQPVGQATFKVLPGDVLVWTRFWGVQRSQGLYTQAMRFSGTHGGARIDARTGEKDFYLENGFSETDDGWLVSDKKALKAWLKGR